MWCNFEPHAIHGNDRSAQHSFPSFISFYQFCLSANKIILTWLFCNISQKWMFFYEIGFQASSFHPCGVNNIDCSNVLQLVSVAGDRVYVERGWSADNTPLACCTASGFTGFLMKPWWAGRSSKRTKHSKLQTQKLELWAKFSAIRERSYSLSPVNVRQKSGF